MWNTEASIGVFHAVLNVSDLSDISAMKENGNILVEKKMDGFAGPKLFFLLSSYQLVYTEAADHFSQDSDESDQISENSWNKQVFLHMD